jgi:hypothetical protein
MSHARGRKQVVAVRKRISAYIRLQVQGLRALSRTWTLTPRRTNATCIWIAEVAGGDDPRAWTFDVATAGTTASMSLSLFANDPPARVRQSISECIADELGGPRDDTMYEIRNAQLRGIQQHVLCMPEPAVPDDRWAEPMQQLRALAWNTRFRWRGLERVWDELAAVIRLAANDPLLEMPLCVTNKGLVYVRQFPNTDATPLHAFAACGEPMRRLARLVSRARAAAVFLAMRRVVYRQCDPLHARAVQFVVAATRIPAEIKHMIVMEYCVPIHHAELSSV